MAQKEKALLLSDRIQSALCQLSDEIWDHPEIGYQETFAANAYCALLEEYGFQIERSLCGIQTAFRATYGHGSPKIGFLGEFDALGDMSQQAEVLQHIPVTPGAPGHGCGHNLLGVGSLAAALSVKQYLDAGHDGTVIFLGCPAEEGGAGKGFLARDGAFDDLDVALTWHPGDTNSVGSGSTLANYQACYHFKGRSAHAAISPELGRSALDAVELMNVGVQFLREHIPQDCRVHYAITNTGGSAPGVVQAEADVLYLMRAPQLSQAKDLYQRVNDIAHGAAQMTGTTVEIEFIKACSNILVNHTLGHVMQKNLEALGSADYDDADRKLAQALRDTMDHKDEYYRMLVRMAAGSPQDQQLLDNMDAPLHDVIIPYIEQESSSMASSDVGDVSWVCPVVQLSTVTMPAGTCMHSWQEVSVGKSAIAKKGMLQAGKILAATAIDLLQDPELIRAAKAEQRLKAGNQPFESPIPKGVQPKQPL